MKEKKILWIIIFNLIIIFSEILFGIISNSFALIADALHNAGDVIAIVITYIALKLGTRKTTFKYTFGFLRSEMMAAFVNTLFLSITMIYMVYEAVSRFFYPEIIEPIYMIVVGIIAVIANGISAYLLNNMNVSTHTHHEHHHEHGEDTNIKSAYLHMLSDALISVGVVTAGVFIYFFRIYYIDSILTIIFSFYILRHSYPLLKKSFLSLMDANITEISPHELDKIIKINENIIEYHDLHIYKPSSKYNFISFHIVLKNNNLILKEIEEITGKIKYNLKKYDFNHILIQVDTGTHIKNKINCELKE
ncbi:MULTISPECIES: cation diffusion facilitator family transporter [Psychrilyobacter]|uniref:Cation diffusion facilitator family transporter n=1 Tax=Psychrilyobacter piezotolerans TaxID=2293438 RepID=A0ABX9KJ23_9FUSO|nr:MULTISPECIES: cation diffusion facilitator family transporter [Psychrilyobacter]MCS5422943.1 cation diffusion facilitator family transporter [Psychrilyobacter sp. S5]NDI77198.1 cation transporter [Psychrilyobacter piezotolerans]RDE64189.1 cation transporter [Psychrilyobacter sp. S5]REI42281.1 cation diffusion facilitator family transporter [Psychrilyobacter piezotolerans]